jgi:hypothetical protein
MSGSEVRWDSRVLRAEKIEEKEEVNVRNLVMAAGQRRMVRSFPGLC